MAGVDAMSGKLVGMVFDHYPFPGGEKLLAVKLADNAHDNGCSIFPSVATLSRQTHQSERTIQYQLKRMMARGWLVLVKHAHGGRGHAREYRIHPDFISAYDSRTLPEQRPTWEFKSADNHCLDVGVGVESEAIKGANIAPFMDPQRVQPETLKGATAVAQKGAIAVAPQPSLTVIEPNTPLPPTGGEAEKFDINDLLAKIIEAHGCHGTSDTRAVLAELGKIGPDSASAKRLLADLRAEAGSNPQWQRDEGRFRPRLSKWLRGWRAAVAVGLPGAGAQSAAPSAVDKTRELIAQMPVKAGTPSPEVLERMAKIRADARSATAGKGLRGRAGSVVRREVEQESLSAKNEGMQDGED